jgi:serine palmitoyltransferase
MGIPVRLFTVAVALAGLAYLLYDPSLSVQGVSLSQISTRGSVPAAVEGARRLAGVAWLHLKPGGIYHPREFLETYHGHYYVELVLLVIIGRYMLEGSRRVGGGKESGPLTAEEVEALCAEWVPEGLCGGVDRFQRRWMDWGLMVLGRVGNGRLDVEVGDGVVVRGALDLVTTDWFEVSGSEQAQSAGQKTLDVIGVGSCGPRGFYGTVDVHLELEDILAKFLRTEEAILYSYDSATVPSIIPAFANAKDTLVIDDGCAYAVRLGCQLSRATVFTFRHNDMDDLELVLKKVVEDDRRKRKPLNRRFVIVEGLYHHTGDIADLKSIVEIKNRYKFRLLVDESLSIGTLGATGRGACEHCGVAPEDVEILAGSLGHGVGSIGGFCAGAREMVDHQRLSGLGYCFSASLPPYLASTSCAVIREWMDDTVRLRGLQKKLWANGAAFREAFGKAVGPNGRFEVLGDVASPLLHVRFREVATKGDEVTEQDLKLQMAVERALEKDKVLFTVAKYSNLDAPYRPRPSIKVALKSSLSEADARLAAKSLAQSLVSA